MKIAISATGKTLDSLMDLKFGRCQYFLIYDPENKQVSCRENKGQLSEGGAGIAAAQQLIDEKVDLVITGSLGPNAFELINKAGIKAYRGENVSIKNILDKHDKCELSEIKQPGQSHHGAGSGFGGGR